MSSELWVAVMTFLGALLVFFQTNREQKLNYLSNEEVAWRKELKKCIQTLYIFRGQSSKNINETLYCLMTLLNPYGKNYQRVGTREAYAKDSHIWITIREIENNPTNCNAIRRLIDYLELLLKFDWEESKEKLRYKIFYGFIYTSLIIYTVLFILWIIQQEWNAATDTIISVSIPWLGLIMNLIALGIFYGNGKILYLGEHSSLGGEFLNSFFLICYMLPTLGLVMHYNEKLVGILSQYSILVDVNKVALTWILIGLVYLFEIIFLVLITSHKMRYFSAINSAEHQYLSQELVNLKELLIESGKYEEDKQLKRLYGKVDKYIHNVTVQEFQNELTIEKAIRHIDQSYLWELSSFKKLIKYLKRNTRSKNKFRALYIDIKNALKKFKEDE